MVDIAVDTADSVDPVDFVDSPVDVESADSPVDSVNGSVDDVVVDDVFGSDVDCGKPALLVFGEEQAPETDMEEK